MATQTERKGKTVLLSGATGLIGRALIRELLKSSYRVRALVRDVSSARSRIPAGAELHEWGGDGSPIEPGLLAGIEAVVHLAGEPVAGQRWTEQRKKRLMDSRVRSTETLVAGLAALAPERRPRVFLCASAIGFYGDRGDEIIDESSVPGHGFLADLSRRWEQATLPLDALGIRRVNLRTGIVLDPSGGALAELLRVFKIGLGGPLGSGKQWMSWIHRDDEIGAILFLLLSDGVRGPVNLVAPEAVTNREFSSILGHALRRPAVLRAPGFALRLGLGEMAGMLLEGQRVKPRKLSEAGFVFKYPELAPALDELLRGSSSSASA